MINIIDLLRKFVDADLLRQHIFNNAGGNSQTFLRKIMGLSDNTSFEVCVSDAHAMLEKYGPALVSSFGVYECFNDMKTTTLRKRPSGGCIGHHALTLIGFRKDIDGNILYLNQNWWYNKPFVEMDLDYLKACGGVITFVTQPHFSIPENFKINSNRYIEASCDSCEQVLDTAFVKYIHTSKTMNYLKAP